MEALKNAIVASADPNSAEAASPPGVEAIYKAIVEEVKWRHNWSNASQLFDGFLCPLILASTPSGPAATGTDGGDGDAERLSSSSSTGDGTSQPKMKLNRELTAQEIQWIQWAISALVRYAPGPQEANRVYMFFLQQCRPPLRDDKTINHCLVSLIYQYAQVKGNDALMAQGLDLIQVALDRGVGLPTYEATPSTSQRQRRMQFEKNLQRQGKMVYHQQKDSILASVSRPILRYHHLRIAEDGQSLVELPQRPAPHARQPQASYRAPYQQQQQQQQQQQSQQQYLQTLPHAALAPTHGAPAPKYPKKKKQKKPVAPTIADQPRVEAPSAADTAATATSTAGSAAAAAAIPAVVEEAGSQPSALSSSSSARTAVRPSPPRHPHHYVYSDEPSEKKKKGKKVAAVSSFASLSTADQGEDNDKEDENAGQAASRDHSTSLYPEDRRGLGSSVPSGMSGRPKKQSTTHAAGQSKMPKIRFVAASSSASSSPPPPPLSSSEKEESAPSSGAEETRDDNSTAPATTPSASPSSKRANKPPRFSSDESAHPEATTTPSTTTTTQNEDEGLSKQMESMGISDGVAQHASLPLPSSASS
ncbi:hypothetical protein BGZ73_002558 [Actinomortierella ambigua]|nr:hypothetical protein BGZ73_002558 [Actinomortierella ambigua]